MLVTGIKEIDTLHIPSRNSFLVLGDPQESKLIFLEQVAFHSLKAGYYCIFITTERSPKFILQNMSRFNWDVQNFLKDRKFFFIDCCSAYLEKREKVESTVFVDSLSALNDISINLTNLLRKVPKESEVIILLHSLSTLLQHNKPSEIYKFLQVMVLRLLQRNSIILVEMDETMHEEKVVNMMKHLMDNIIEFKREVTSALRIRGSINTEWFKYLIGKNGMEVLFY